MYTGQTLDAEKQNLRKRRYFKALKLWSVLEIPKRKKLLIELGYNKAFAYREFPFLYANILEDIIDSMHLMQPETSHIQTTN